VTIIEPRVIDKDRILAMNDAFRILHRTIFVIMLWSVLMVLPLQVAAIDQGKVDFNRDIKPILSNNCFACHGPDEKERKAKLRLDTRVGAIADLDGYSAVAPGKPDDSELIIRITSDDPKEVMPPPKHGRSLSKADSQMLSRWIAQGAKYDKHWSYVKPVRPSLPKVKNTRWPANAIDTFILARLEAMGLTPEQPADRYALIRRLSLDLTGLPPTIKEVDDFVNDKRPDAYDHLVETILAKSTYGEHFANFWLDLARYADSAGYADDPKRTIWAYRDYVVKSFNDNKPFNLFTIEQLAGDMLASPTQEQLVATAFHRNTLTNNEGGTSDEEFRNVAIVDRTNTTMQVWMGTTMACAQCHTHKYDPITNEEYFRFFALLNNTADADRRNESPTISVMASDDKGRYKALAAQIAEVEKQIAAKTREVKKKQGKWEADVLAAENQETKARFVRVQILNRAEYLSLAEVQVFSGGKNVAVKKRATQSSNYSGGGAAGLGVDGNTNGDFSKAKSTTHTEMQDNPWWMVDLGKSFSIEKIVIWNRTQGGEGISGRLRGFRVEALDDSKKTVWREDVKQSFPVKKAFATGTLPADLLATVKLPASKRNKSQAAKLTEYFIASTGELLPLNAKVVEIKGQLKSNKPLTTVPVLQELPKGKGRKTHIQIRGNYLVNDREVTGGLPAVFHAPPKGAAMNRLTLAKWIVSDDNPLTARVAVNRYWESVFGTGIVATSEEFGSQGELPSHPALLDWLAVEFVKSGWDAKHLLRLIVKSNAYRQSSLVTAAKQEADPFNRYLSRGPRVRASAEVIRDQALFVSGLLSMKIGGAPVQPPRPKLGLRAAFGGSTDWNDSKGADRYRRGLYTEWRRSMPYPSMATFDKPSREVCISKRSRTNTPLQALVTLNDPVFIEAAQALGRRVVTDLPKGSIEDRVAYAFRLCLARNPKSAELNKLVALHAKLTTRFAKDPANAMTLATVPLGALPKSADVTDAAAWTVVSNVLLNLDEMFLKR
jgi:hypothetical protein